MWMSSGQTCAANRDLVTEVPADRWDWHAHYGDPAKEPGKTKVTSAGFIADVDAIRPVIFWDRAD